MYKEQARANQGHQVKAGFYDDSKKAVYVLSAERQLSEDRPKTKVATAFMSSFSSVCAASDAHSASNDHPTARQMQCNAEVDRAEWYFEARASEPSMSG